MSFYSSTKVIHCKDCGDKILSTDIAINISTAICIKCQQMRPDYVPQHQAEADRIAAAKALDDPIPYTPITREQVEIPELKQETRADTGAGNPKIARHSPRVIQPPVPEATERESNVVQKQLASAMGSLKKTWRTKPSSKKKK